MIEYLKLTNFKRHEHLEINLQGGLTVLAGSNEAGKSSVLHAIFYALYGSRALPLSLEETVTYGKSASSLRVDLQMRVGGITYTIYRSKSGAEMSGGGTLSTGQSEVTAAVERLLGVPMAVASKVLIANQVSLRGVVDEGSAAVKLIEELADLDAIEVLVDKVQSQLPTGSTTALAAQAAALAEVAEPVLADLSSDITSAEEAAANLERALADATSRTAAARADLQLATAQQAAYAAWKREFDRLNAVLAAPRTQEQIWTVNDIEQLELAAQAQRTDAARRAAWATWQGLVPVAEPGPAPVKFDNKLVENAQLALQAARLRRINDESCGLCGKLLQEVPEVVTGNAKVDAEVARLSAELEQMRSERSAAEVAHDSWTQASTAYRVWQAACARLEPHVQNGVWVGGEVPAEIDTTDYAARIKDEHEKRRKMAVLAERMRNEEAQIAAATATLAALVQPATPPSVSDLTENVATLVAVERAAAQESKDAAAHLQALRSQDAASKAAYAAECKAFEAAKQQRAGLLATIASMDANNSLVKKLRTARPAIAAKLWAGLLGAISATFSQLRGTPSTVTRSSDGFRVNDKPVAALSGSTLDVLGLAVRVNLLRAFLPGVGMLILDEPTAACDDDREATLLGTLVSLGLDQVLLVSHSDSAKAVAGDVVQL